MVPQKPAEGIPTTRPLSTIGTLALLVFVSIAPTSAFAESDPSATPPITPVTEPIYELFRLPDQVVMVDTYAGPVGIYTRFFAPTKILGQDGVLGTSDDVQVPVVLEYTPYSDGSNWNSPDSNLSWFPGPDEMPIGFFGRRGYVVAMADMTGTGRSRDECQDLWGQKDREAAYGLVEFLASQSWSNGKVGMIGNSAPGISAVMTAAAHPPHLAAIAVGSIASNLYNIYFHDAAPLSFSDPAQSVLLSGPMSLNPVFPNACIGTLESLGLGPAMNPDPIYNDIWRERDWTDDGPNLAVPAPGTGWEVAPLTMGSWRDALLKSPESINWFDSIPMDDPTTPSDEGVPFKMAIMDHGAHGRTIGFWKNVTHAWFDDFLYGYDTNIRLQTPFWSVTNSPKTEAPHTDPNTVVEEAYTPLRMSDTWPPAGTENVRLFLRGDGSLGLKFNRDSEVLGTFTDPGSLTEGEILDRVNARSSTVGSPTGPEFDGFLWFESGPLERDLRLAGRPFLTIRAQTDGPSTHFTPVLFDLGAHTDTPLRTGGPCMYSPFIAPHIDPDAEPLVNPVDPGGNDVVYAIRPDGCTVSRGFLNARYLDGIESPSDLVPNEAYTARVRFLDEDWVVPAGHRIGVAVASSNAWWALSDEDLATNTVYGERGNRSFIELPIVGGKDVAREAFPEESDPWLVEDEAMQLVTSLG